MYSLSLHAQQMQMRRHTGTSSPPVNFHTYAQQLHPAGPLLPIVPNREHPELATITPETLYAVLTGELRGRYEQIQLLDCRFKFEYDGGHVAGALHLPQPEMLASLFFDSSKSRPHNPFSVLFVFYCEFSQKRGPCAANHMRRLDREDNATAYPRVHYPLLYLLQGGYSSFFAKYRNLCVPEAYVPMDDKDHVTECRAAKSLSSQLALARSRSCSLLPQTGRF
jgi:M-phase inducer tyrosine phosphatase